ncbi:hypothetical protein HRI_003528700 [Hibiscus trionum]|uniref:Uncharacterized protein n=1 Tax=Hibiscus trionum TaxID=183268 RepID=A0A9W7IL33_HIBTR|nr:hypothetical protein HRI_003528700 [Hibiscus trionum]
MKMKKNSNALVFSLLLASIILAIASSGFLCVEARIPNFSAIEASLKSGMQRRNLKPLPPAHGKSPDPNTQRKFLPPAGIN